MLDWILQNETLLWWLGIGSVVTFIGSLLFVPLLVVRIPHDYLLGRDERRERRKQQHPVLQVVGVIVKNILGLILIVAGIAMLALPGQGLLTILIGLLLLNFPGKRRFLRRILGRPSILGAINRMRARRGRAPLLVKSGSQQQEPQG